MLSGLARRRRLLSQEASLKYFLLGAFSSAFFLFGAALLYGYAGSMQLLRHRHGDHASSPAWTACCCPGVVLVSVGLLFKVGAVPFHSWTPDVYQGAPTPVTGFMAACTKVAAFGAILRRVLRRRRRQPLGLAAGAVGRRDPDHGGRVGARRSPRPTSSGCWPTPRSPTPGSSSSVCWPSTGPASPAVLFYLVAYGFTTIAAFAVVTLVRDRAGPRRRTCRSGPGWAGAPARRRRSSRSCCWPSPASR